MPSRLPSRLAAPLGAFVALALTCTPAALAARDRTPPTTPVVSLSQTLPSELIAGWGRSSDNVGVSGYRLYLDKRQVASVTALKYDFTGLSCGTSHTLGVQAYDRAGNLSPIGTATGSTSTCPVAAPPPAPSSPAPSQFVGRQGGVMTLGGLPWTFTGLNLFQANMTAGIANCSGWAINSDLDNQLSLIGAKPNSVIRAWFFQKMATTAGQRDWTAFDHTLAVARAHGVRVIATLVDQWDYCEGPYKDESWYAGGYRTSVLPGDTVPYRDWVAEVTARYRDDPTIAFWELANEPEIQSSESATSCPADAEPVMQSWAGDVSSVIKAHDPDHLVSLGTGGNGNCGLIEDDYAKVQALPGIDLCSYHDYWGAQVALSTDPYNGIQRRITQCAALGKPIYAGEVGIKLQDVTSLQQRADLLAQKRVAQLAAGVDGFLAWNWARASDVDYRIGPGDPALAALSPG
jgi:hypothetical protein